MIELGVARIACLLQHSPLTWRAIHVAGTNGKGSVCAYTSAMLNAAKIRCGRFTSPHLIDRWDCIVINEKVVDQGLFRLVEASIMNRNKDKDIRASEFELLTATAFELFTREKVEVGVIEVGLGGKEDATNILRDPMITVITKIGIDHQEFLGDSLEEIASQKAGIMKPGTPCFVDATNPANIINVFKETAKVIQAGPITPIPRSIDMASTEIWDFVSKNDFEAHQQINICLAVAVVKYVLHHTASSLKIFDLLHVISTTVWPGRLQYLSIKAITGRQRDILLDGAHNAQSAEVLGSHVDTKLRKNGAPVTWVMAFSKGKDLFNLVSSLVRDGDYILANQFGPVEGMPWVQSADVKEILKATRTLGLQTQFYESLNLSDALSRATELSKEGPLVVAGSLYQISDVLRLTVKHQSQIDKSKIL